MPNSVFCFQRNVVADYPFCTACVHITNLTRCLKADNPGRRVIVYQRTVLENDISVVHPIGSVVGVSSLEGDARPVYGSRTLAVLDILVHHQIAVDHIDTDIVDRLYTSDVSTLFRTGHTVHDESVRRSRPVRVEVHDIDVTTAEGSHFTGIDFKDLPRIGRIAEVYRADGSVGGSQADFSTVGFHGRLIATVVVHNVAIERFDSHGLSHIGSTNLVVVVVTHRDGAVGLNSDIPVAITNIRTGHHILVDIERSRSFDAHILTGGHTGYRYIESIFVTVGGCNDVKIVIVRVLIVNVNVAGGGPGCQSVGTYLQRPLVVSVPVASDPTIGDQDEVSTRSRIDVETATVSVSDASARLQDHIRIRVSHRRIVCVGSNQRSQRHIAGTGQVDIRVSSHRLINIESPGGFYADVSRSSHADDVGAGLERYIPSGERGDGRGVGVYGNVDISTVGIGCKVESSGTTVDQFYLVACSNGNTRSKSHITVVGGDVCCGSVAVDDTASGRLDSDIGGTGRGDNLTLQCHISRGLESDIVASFDVVLQCQRSVDNVDTDIFSIHYARLGKHGVTGAVNTDQVFNRSHHNVRRERREGAGAITAGVQKNATSGRRATVLSARSHRDRPPVGGREEGDRGARGADMPIGFDQDLIGLNSTLGERIVVDVERVATNSVGRLEGNGVAYSLNVPYQQLGTVLSFDEHIDVGGSAGLHVARCGHPLGDQINFACREGSAVVE